MWLLVTGCVGLICGLFLATPLINTARAEKIAPLSQGVDTLNAAPFGTVISNDPVARTVVIQPLLDNNEIGQVRPVPQKFVYDDSTVWKKRLLSGAGGIAVSVRLSPKTDPFNLLPGMLILIQRDPSVYMPLKALEIVALIKEES